MVLLNDKLIFEKKIMEFFLLYEFGVYSRVVWI